MKQQETFQDLAVFVKKNAQSGECILANWNGEDSDFSRLNHNKIRQIGSVEQMYVHMELLVGQRHSSINLSLSSDQQHNDLLLQEGLALLRQQIAQCVDDPFLLYNTKAFQSEDIRSGVIPNTHEALTQLHQEAEGLDLVGIWASGTLYRGFCNSLGQQNWFQQQNAHCDWSLYHQTDKAVKCSYAASNWDSKAFSQAIQRGITELSYMKYPAQTIDPGSYRVYLSPAAVNEILGIISWRGFSYKLQHTKQSSLQLLINGKRQLHSDLYLSEDYQTGLGPSFTSKGHQLPASVSLIEAGKHANALCDARSAKEYTRELNAGAEHPQNLSMRPGKLKQTDILKSLDTGIYINNLWYLNYSDPMAGQITGMTRFACFWVENGKIVAPINVMRFDDSIFNILGDQLEAITDTCANMPDASSYNQRSTSSSRLPGIVVKQLRFTL